MANVERVTITLPNDLVRDHLRSIDKRRIRRAFGALPHDEIAAVDEGLTAFLGFGAQKASDSPVH